MPENKTDTAKKLATKNDDTHCTWRSIKDTN